MAAFFIICVVGILACATLDLWQRTLLLVFKVPPSNWAMVGRWLFLFLKNKAWVQNDLSQQVPVRNELSIGWGFHYAVAIAYALFYFFLFEHGLINFKLVDGLLFGCASVVVPWFLFMPAIGAGLLGSRTPNPVLACVLALIAHTIFGGAIAVFFNLFYY